MNIDDTIVAISTSISGEGGIGIVRLSGKDSLPIADKLFQAKDANADKPSGFMSHTVHYGWIVEGNERIDEVLLTVMMAPKTYTRQDIVEISGHGGPVVLRKILELCLKYGARFAQPGEFTKRAFLNGRIDLSQAEAVSDLIRAKTDKSAVIAVNQLKGVLSDKVRSLRDKFVGLIAGIEVSLDYSEEDIVPFSSDEVAKIIKSLRSQVDDIVAISQKNRIYVEGVKVAIVGKPNVGKSSLLNAFLSQERAIVTPVPGTTRDIISETVNFKGIPLTIMDTAGIRSHYHSTQDIDSQKAASHEDIEKLAVERSKQAIEKADIVLFVFDMSVPANEDDRKIADLISSLGRKTVIVFNKEDLGKDSLPDIGFLNKKLVKGKQLCSALYDKGIDELKEKIYGILVEGIDTIGAPESQETGFTANIRQQEALRLTGQDLDNTIKSVSAKESPEFVILHLRSALGRLGEITGETTTEEILDNIFSKFCVGK